ncbi:MAG: hypothetical protein BGO39_23745 [Chloroflexi bacterium 54-19]|nr:MAG: hypothetical protein BGO39_23745 [Chloroflexi bacterium 54-19]
MIPLNKITPGTHAKIVGLKATGLLLQRLLAMGFTRECEIKMVKRAPLGDPIQFRVRGSAVSLRSSEAALVLVTVPYN